MTAERPDPERTHWGGEGVRIDQVVAELARMHRAHAHDGHRHALTRTLNLIVAPSSPGAKAGLDAALGRLGAHSPSRVLILRSHRADRLDAEAMLECELADAAGRVGVCHDEITLTADDSRLVHSGSLVAPLLLADLPTVLWVPEPDSPIPDASLLERAQQVIVDSGGAGPALGGVAALARGARVHDLSWGRLEFWRAATAAAFEPLGQRTMLTSISAIQINHDGDAFGAAALFSGWIIARAGWEAGRLDRDDGIARAAVKRPGGGRVALSLAPNPEARGCGGIESITFRAGSDELTLERGAATSRLRDLFAEALQPQPSFARGYSEALGVAATMLGDEA